MEDQAQWMAAGLFSPSKARQQQAQAKDWLYADDWLRQKYAPGHVPSFERTEGTLQSLLKLIAQNEQADERQALLREAAEKVLLDSRQQLAADQDTTFERALEGSLDVKGRAALDSMADAVVSLGCQDPQPEVIARRIMESTRTDFDLQQQLENTTNLRKAVQLRKVELEEMLREVSGPAFVASSGLPGQTLEWNRSSKQLKNKLVEYDDRLQNARTIQPSPSMEELEAQIARGMELRARIRALEERLALYRNLPTDARDARAHVDEAKARLHEMVTYRDELFARLVDDE